MRPIGVPIVTRMGMHLMPNPVEQWRSTSGCRYLDDPMPICEKGPRATPMMYARLQYAGAAASAVNAGVAHVLATIMVGLPAPAHVVRWYDEPGLGRLDGRIKRAMEAAVVGYVLACLRFTAQAPDWTGGCMDLDAMGRSGMLIN